MTEPPKDALWKQNEDNSQAQWPGHRDFQAKTSEGRCAQRQLQCHVSYQSRHGNSGHSRAETKRMSAGEAKNEGCPEKKSLELAFIMKGKEKSWFSFLKNVLMWLITSIHLLMLSQHYIPRLIMLYCLFINVIENFNVCVPKG